MYDNLSTCSPLLSHRLSFTSLPDAMARACPDAPSHSSNGDAALRESILLPEPPTFAVSKPEAEKWNCLKNDALSSAIQHTFARLLIILVCDLCADVEHEWIQYWHHSFSPLYVHSTVRYAILDSILQLARSPDAKPDLEWHSSIEAWQAFLRPILPQDHPCFSARSPQPFQSSDIWRIQSILDSQKHGTDAASILELNGRLRQILSPELIAVPEMSVPVSFTSGSEFVSRCRELQALLGADIEDDCITVLAYSKCGWGSEFLHHWSGTLEAAWLIDSLLRKIEDTSDRHLQMLSHLVAANLIYHHLVGSDKATHCGSRLPWGLSQWECYLVPEGLASSARFFGVEWELQKIASKSLFVTADLSHDTAKQWEELWRQRFPPLWRPYMSMSARHPDKELPTEDLDHSRQSGMSHRSGWSGGVGWMWSALCPGSTDT